MAVLPKIFPNVFVSQTGSWSPTTPTTISNGVLTPSGSSIVSGSNSAATLNFGLTDMPSNFGKITALNYSLRYSITGLSDDTLFMYFRVFKSDLTTPLTNEMLVVQRTTSIGLTNILNVAFTGVDLDALKADWDGAVLQVRTNFTQNMAKDASAWQINEIEINGTYQSPPTAVLNTPADAATGVTVLPTLDFTGTDAESDAVGYEVYIGTSFPITDNFFETYYFNASQNIPVGVPLDSSNTWSNDANIANGNVLDYATTTSTAGTIIVKGTNAPSVSNNVIVSVSARAFGYSSSDFSHYVTGGISTETDEVLGQTFNNTVTPQWSTKSLATPSGGWTWDKISKLQLTGKMAFGNNCGISICEIIVEIKGNYLYSAKSATDAGFPAGHPYASGAQKSYTVQSALANSTVYYWRARAIDPSGSNTYGAWSGTRSFTTIQANQPPTVTLQNPADSATGVSISPQFDFTGTDLENNSIGYEIEVDNAALGYKLHSSESLRHIAINENSKDIYASDGNSVGILLKQTGGTGLWEQAGLSDSYLNDIAINSSNGDVWVSLGFSGIKKQTGGTGSWAVVTAPNIEWNSSIAVNPDNGDVYVGNNIGQVFKLTSGIGSWVLQGTMTKEVIGIAINRNNLDVVICEWTGLVRKMAGGVGSFVSLGANNSEWSSIQVESSSGDIYANIYNGQVYKLKEGTGSWAAQEPTVAGSIAIALDSVTKTYYATTNQGVYKLKVGVFTRKFSATDAGFTAGHPYASGVQKSYTAQTALTSNITYYWRVRAIDPTGSNTYGAWSTTRSFVTIGGTIVYNGILKMWNGSAWVKAKLKRWDGSAWVATTLKRWDGSAWKNTDTTGI
jgi:hypothetical protein